MLLKMKGTAKIASDKRQRTVSAWSKCKHGGVLDRVWPPLCCFVPLLRPSRSYTEFLLEGGDLVRGFVWCDN